MVVVPLVRRYRVAFFTRSPTLARDAESVVRAHPLTAWSTHLDSVDSAFGACTDGRLDVMVIDSDCDPDWKMCLLLTKLHPELIVVALQSRMAVDPLSSAWALVHGARGVIGMAAMPHRLGDAVVSAIEKGRYVDADLLKSLTCTMTDGAATSAVRDVPAEVACRTTFGTDAVEP